MSRRDLSEEEEKALHEPVLEALDNYFDAVYDPEDTFCSMGAGASTDENKVLMITAFRVPREKAAFIRRFLLEQARIFADGDLRIDEEPDFTNTTH